MMNFIKKPVVFIPLLFVLAVAALIYFYFFMPKKPGYEFVVARRAELVQEVLLTGRVKPAKSVSLGFENSGRVSQIYVKTGDKVASGQILIKLENAELLAKLLESQANAKAEKAKLDELKRGARLEEIQIQEVKVQNAKTALQEANKNLNDKLQDSYTKSDDAVRNKVDQLFSNPKSQNPEINIPIIDSQLKINIEQERTAIENVLNEWKETKSNLGRVKSFLDKISLAVNSLTPLSALSKTTIDGYKTDISTARTNVNTAIANLLSAEEKLSAAESNLVLAENELILKKAGATTEQISAEEALLEQAEAGVKNIQSQIAKTVLRSPIDGVVSKQEAKIGEIVPANIAVVSVISENEFEIEADAPEADIAKIKIGHNAKITLDAYGPDTVFEAKVVKIDPAETIVGGVAVYKITLQFIDEDGRVKSGMTANVSILAEKKENVIAVPQRAVITRDAEKILRILEDDGAIREMKVLTGLRGSDGNIEIIEGIKEEDKVIIFETSK